MFIKVIIWKLIMTPKWLQELSQKKISEINHITIEVKNSWNSMIKQNQNDTGFREGGRTVGSGRGATIIE